VTVDLDFRKDPGDTAFAVDDHCSPLDTHVLASVKRLLLPHSERISKAVTLVGEQEVRQLVLLLEFAVGIDAVGTDSKYYRIQFPEPGKRVAKIARFPGSARGVVLRIEEQDDVLPAKRVESDRGAVVGGE
jgi:hypothetical protein